MRRRRSRSRIRRRMRRSRMRRRRSRSRIRRRRFQDTGVIPISLVLNGDLYQYYLNIFP